MFTGIVAATGRITRATPLAGADAGMRIEVDTGRLELGDVAIGDSVAVSGVCLTVVERGAGTLHFDVSAESLRCTAGLAPLGAVNLEKALRFGDRLGGHLVSGHVDGVGTVTKIQPVGESHLLEVDAPPGLSRYIAVKGSITIDGVSLTVNAVDRARFSVNLIPHTLEVTTLSVLKTGQRVNLEVDMLARYLERLMEGRVVVAVGASELPTQN